MWSLSRLLLKGKPAVPNAEKVVRRGCLRFLAGTTLCQVDGDESQNANLSHMPRSTMKSPSKQWRNKKGRSSGRFVMLQEWLQKSEAWATMKPGPRALYVEIKRRFKGSNNGQVIISHRDAVKALNVAKDTATGYFHELTERGFVTMTQGGCLGPSGIGQAAKWALQEEPVDGKAATKAFMSWRAKQKPVQKTRTLRPETGTERRAFHYDWSQPSRFL